ncbi:uncharacterized protein TNCV_811061 [Trichonephila clavipes]|uniref:Uncharacterized protein n=1 Tax=Trichonephila clavipes TaxID=2585209 RepID=A0A8X6SKJ5_TRICX|nr:uncharacterized protein TNCV_811061 [Trichonephila clavipes]
MIGRRVTARQPPPTCLPELRRALLDEWCNIPQDQIDNLILSMPRRCLINALKSTLPRTSGAQLYVGTLDLPRMLETQAPHRSLLIHEKKENFVCDLRILVKLSNRAPLHQILKNRQFGAFLRVVFQSCNPTTTRNTGARNSR